MAQHPACLDHQIMAIQIAVAAQHLEALSPAQQPGRDSVKKAVFENLLDKARAMGAQIPWLRMHCGHAGHAGLPRGCGIFLSVGHHLYSCCKGARGSCR